jgi:hypothetical protein
MNDRILQKDIPQNRQMILAQSLHFLHDDTATMLRSGRFTYDAYVEAYIRRFITSDKDILTPFIASEGVSTKSDLSKYSKHDILTSLIDHVESVRPKASILLLDPLIALRANAFIDFLKITHGENALGIRREFIKTFNVDTFYRGILPQKTDFKRNVHFAPSVRRALKDTGAYLKKREEILHGVDEAALKEQPFYLLRYGLPFLMDVDTQAFRHVGNRETGKDLISISKFPELVWYVLSDNGKKYWKSASEPYTLRIFRFEMNSFYTLPTYVIFPDMKESGRSYVIDGGKEHYEIPVQTEGIEYLVPINLPENFAHDYRDFSPEFDDHMPISFHVPTTADWV